jgi:hypothetical protein
LLNPDSDILLTPKKKHSLLPTLVVLFLVSYGLMATLVVEQARTIDSQRALVLTLFGDSGELTALKGKLFQEQRAKNGAPAKAQPGAQAQTPAAPQSQAPAAAPKNNKKDSNVAKALRPTPERPPSASADTGDVRRTLLGI